MLPWGYTMGFHHGVNPGVNTMVLHHGVDTMVLHPGGNPGVNSIINSIETRKY